MPVQVSLLLRRAVALAMLGVLVLAAAPAASAPTAGQRAAPTKAELERAAKAAANVPAATMTTARESVPEDRYAMANGCYALRSVANGGYVQRTGDGLKAKAQGEGAAEPFHFQATDLGAYLLFGSKKDFLAASEGELGKAAEQVTDSSVGGAVGGLTVETTDKAAREAARGPAGTASGRGARILMAGKPSKLADWEVTRNADGSFRFFLPSLDRVLAVNDAGTPVLAAADTMTDAAAFALSLTRGCATWPEVEVNVEGPVATGDTAYGEVRGYNDAHLHSMAFEFLGGRARCGRPWHRYGVAYALRGCKEHEIAGGRAAVLENVLSGRDMAKGHDTNSGWPTFKDWPKPNALTYEQVYYKWLERAWRGGLRMYTNLLVDNNQLCKIYPYKKHGCNEMDGVRRQYQRIQEFERYIDAQSGGPGEGWFRIVDDPFEARRIMNSGRLAVVMGIEVSVLFDCGTIRGQALCDADQIDQRLDEVYAMGVRQMELVNKFDNALAGVTGDAGIQGPLVNSANFMETGSFWQMKTCADEHTHAHDKQQPNFHDESRAPKEFSGRDALVGVLLSEFGSTGAAPVYGPGPHCSQTGLSPLGEHLIRRMMQKKMIFDPDHMSAKARTQALDIIESASYSGVISSHSWADNTIYPRIWKAGGVVTPHAGSSQSFVKKWQDQKAIADDRYLFGLGFGSDMNGFSNQGQPRGANAPDPVTYPFTGLGGVQVHKQVSGEKTYDYNVDGVAHYGMYPDFVEDVRRLGGAQGDEIVADMQRGSEAFLQMWERAMGVDPNACREDVADLDSATVATLQRGMTAEQVLVSAGQPAQRTGNTFTYCTEDGTTTVAFGGNGGLQRVTTKSATAADSSSRTTDATAASTSSAGSGDAGDAASGGREGVGGAGAAGAQGGGQAKQAVARGAAAHDHNSHAHTPVAAVSAFGSPLMRWSAALVMFLVLSAFLVLRNRRAG